MLIELKIQFNFFQAMGFMMTAQSEGNQGLFISAQTTMRVCVFFCLLCFFVLLKFDMTEIEMIGGGSIIQQGNGDRTKRL